MKYVAYIDCLGFKSLIKNLTQDEAKKKIREFNQSVYDLWNDSKLHNNHTINGRTFSDSLIINTCDETTEQLELLLSYLVKLYQVSLSKHGVSLRGGIAVGEYDDLADQSFENLQKGIVVGNGFIDAYMLESSYSVKGSKIIFKENIKIEIHKNMKKYQFKKLKNTIDNEMLYELKWGDIIYLTKNNYQALNCFTEIGTSSKWIDHYYGTLETFLIGESQETKHEIYRRIIDFIKENHKYNDLDNFIMNFFTSQCSENFKKSFSSYLRDKLNVQNLKSVSPNFS